MKTVKAAGLAIAVLIALGAAASAGTITGVNNGLYVENDGVYQVDGPGGTAWIWFEWDDPNNDNISENEDPHIWIEKEFTSLAPIDIEFIGVPSEGTTEYYIYEDIYNFTGVDWPGYELLLGSGVDEQFTGGWSIADFDAPDQDPTPYNSAFEGLSHSAYAIRFSHGTAFNDDSSWVDFNLDVPDFGCAECFTFTLREQPTSDPVVPEPITLALFGLGGLAAALKRPRKF